MSLVEFVEVIICKFSHCKRNYQQPMILSDCNSNHIDYYFRTDGVLFSNDFSQME